MKDQNMIIADNIRRIRKSKGITQEMLAEKSEVSIVTIKKAEAAKSISVDTICKIASALTVPPFQLHIAENLEFTEQFRALISSRSDEEVKYILFVMEKLLEGKDKYFDYRDKG